MPWKGYFNIVIIFLLFYTDFNAAQGKIYIYFANAAGDSSVGVLDVHTLHLGKLHVSLFLANYSSRTFKIQIFYLNRSYF